MKKVFNFSDFNQRIYEAEGATGNAPTSVVTAGSDQATTQTAAQSKPAENAQNTAQSNPSTKNQDSGKGDLDVASLDNVVHFALAALVSMAKVRKEPYQEFTQDLAAIDAAGIEAKEKAVLSMADKIKAAPNTEITGGKEAMDAWYAVAKRAAEGIGEIKDGLKEDKTALDKMNAEIDSLIQAYKKSLGEKLKSFSGIKESLNINEGLFSTKKDAVSNIKGDVTTTISLYAPKRKDPVVGQAYDKAIDSLTALNSKIDEFLTKKNKEIKQADIDALTAEFNKVKEDLGKEESSMIKRSDVYTKASEGIRKLLSELETLRRNADSAEYKYNAEKTQVDSKKKDEDKYKIKASVSFDAAKIKEVNDAVKLFQQLALDKLRPAKDRGLRKIYDELDKFGVDGKFGNKTKLAVETFRAGFEMKDKSPIIDQELIDKMRNEPIEENNRTIYGFYDFDKNISEKFNTEAAVKTWGSSSTAKSSGGSSKIASSNKSTAAKTSGGLLSIGSQEAWDAVSKAITDKKVGSKAKWEKSEYKGRELWRGTYPANSAEFSPESLTILFKDGTGGDYLKSDPSKLLADWKWTWDSGKGKWEFLGTNYTDLGKKSKSNPLDLESAKPISKKIYDACSGAGTDNDALLSAIESIKDLATLKSVDHQLAKYRLGYGNQSSNSLNDFQKKKVEEKKNNLQYYINDEMGGDDFGVVKSIADALNKIKGVKASYEKDGDSFKEDSFKLTF